MQKHFNKSETGPDTLLTKPVMVFFENANFMDFQELSKLN